MTLSFVFWVDLNFVLNCAFVLLLKRAVLCLWHKRLRLNLEKECKWPFDAKLRNAWWLFSSPSRLIQSQHHLHVEINLLRFVSIVRNTRYSFSNFWNIRDWFQIYRDPSGKGEGGELDQFFPFWLLFSYCIKISLRSWRNERTRRVVHFFWPLVSFGGSATKKVESFRFENEYEYET